jgi:hypothetical protein
MIKNENSAVEWGTMRINIYGIGCRLQNRNEKEVLPNQEYLRIGTPLLHSIIWDPKVFTVTPGVKGKWITVSPSELLIEKPTDKNVLSNWYKCRGEFCAAIARIYPYNRIVKRGVLVIDSKGYAILERKSNTASVVE